MKKLIFFFGVALTLNANSQSIENTVWKTYSSLYSDTIEVTFGIDSMHQNGSNLGFIVSSIYTQTGGDTVSFWDIGGNSTLGCNQSDTGVYRAMGFETDTMTLMLINDDCSNRGTSYDGVVFWNTYRPSPPTGVASIVAKNPISLFPNPSNGNFNIYSSSAGNLSVYSMSGQEILHNRIIKEGNNQVNLTSRVSNGLYILKFTSDQKVWNLKHKISIE